MSNVELIGLEPLPPAEPAPPGSSHRDSFTKSPWITVLCLWAIAALPPIFVGAGGLLPSPWLLLSIVAVSVATTVGAILLVINLFRRRWRAALSIIFASAGFAVATLSSVKFSDELRWHVLRPYYVKQIAASSTGPYGIHGIWWGGGSGWDVTLEYHETEADARAWQQTQQGWLGSCKLTLTEIAPHYFLNGVYC